MSDTEIPAQIADFARALDEKDYARAGELLHPDCQYHVRGEKHKGKKAILDSYEAASRWVSQTFDSHRYQNSIHSLSDAHKAAGKSNFYIEFKDVVSLGGKEQSHVCQQHIELDSQGLIVYIRHVDKPDEVQRMSEFLAAAQRK